MKTKYFILLTLFQVVFLHAKSQNLVDTTKIYKNAIIEEYTGVECAGCPSGHTTLQNVLNAHPGRVFAVGINWTSYGYTDPLCAGDPNLGRVRPTGFTTSPSGIPSASLNREKFGLTNMFFYPTSWSPRVDTLLNQVAKLNVGFSSVFNSSQNELTVDIEVYFKENFSTEGLFVVAALTEDSITACQLNSSYDTVPDYKHYHVLRELLTDTSNNTSYLYESVITGSKTKGSLYKTQIKFNNQSLIHQGNMADYHFEKCSLIVYVRSYQALSVYNGLGLKVGQSSIGIENNEIHTIPFCKIYPNPGKGIYNLEFEQLPQEPITISVYSYNGTLVCNNKYFGQSVLLDLEDKPSGFYLLKIQAKDKIFYKKLIKN